MKRSDVNSMKSENGNRSILWTERKIRHKNDWKGIECYVFHEFSLRNGVDVILRSGKSEEALIEFN